MVVLEWLRRSAFSSAEVPEAVDPCASVESKAGPLHIGYEQLAVAVSLLVFIGIAQSYYLQMGLGRKLMMAASRAFVQLSMLGYILIPIFKINEPYLVLPYALFMTLVATHEAQKRTKYVYKGLWVKVWAAVGGTGAFILIFALAFVIGTDPFWDAQYVIPLFGMMLGNMTNGISVGLVTTLTELAEGREQVERLLALGATRWEASRDIIKKSCLLGLTPIINTMMMSGLVSIPGMMTGQILGGTPPHEAAHYQMMVLYLIGSAAAAGTVIASVISVAAVIDAEHHLRMDLLTRREKSVSEGIFDGACTRLVCALRGVEKRLATCLPLLLRRSTNTFQRHEDTPGYSDGEDEDREMRVEDPLIPLPSLPSLSPPGETRRPMRVLNGEAANPT
mmetsp:Transcript_33363/g.55988  ORF Transcript_33363/g.55988 Transcript_33363/m.55988 type:complete len:392 (-) Transcript_33363:122-1297(-)|eukprot:CAMPEP_0198221068 /NCGR_PEP_ID=MMETSP1445-20131203/82023_1 /TAXON_ID=36898 /ORGANISM="Pyramimonas sp., Strain CCMP2087" /LENGTH=391 /DNA_ID=CAMNT_0043899061 /DNA_START=181 /DNA_END=1356 /DNA_ORIENTATION=-